MGLDVETLEPILPDAVTRAATTLLEAAQEAGLSIATAESCTGGLLASLLTDIEGASASFERGFIAYSKQAKCDLLGLSHGLIENYGAVSERVARGMAQGAVEHSEASLAIAITGFAGPAGPGDEPGLVHFACAAHGIATRHRVEHFGDIGRGATRVACLRVALEMLGDMLTAAKGQPRAA